MPLTLDFSNLKPVQISRVHAELDKVYRFSGGRVCSLRAYLEELPSIDKHDSDGMIDYNRRHFNSLEGDTQNAYMARLRAKRYYWINDTKVPKCVYDAVVA